jgi:hypothetical protein
MSSGWKRTGYGGVFKIMPDGEKIYIEKSMDRKGMWESGGRYYEKISEAKAAIDAGAYSTGGLATKNYMNPVKVIDNRRNK